MIQNIKTYINNKYPDRFFKCNAIGRILRKLWLISLIVLLLGTGILVPFAMYIDNIDNDFIFKIFVSICFIPATFVLIFSTISSLILIPIVWFIQCVDCIKNKKDNDEILRNLLFWILLALLSLWIYNDHKATNECMEMCVAEDLSNYDECLNNTCDFHI